MTKLRELLLSITMKKGVSIATYWIFLYGTKPVLALQTSSSHEYVPMEKFTSKLYRKIWGRQDIILKKRRFGKYIWQVISILERYILHNLSELLQPKDKRKTILLTSWVNPFGLILILKEIIFFFIMDKYCYNGFFFINDIVVEDKQFLS